MLLMLTVVYHTDWTTLAKNYVFLEQWFPTFSVSWTLLTIWLKAVDPFNKTSQYSYLQVVSNKKRLSSALCVKSHECSIELST